MLELSQKTFVPAFSTKAGSVDVEARTLEAVFSSSSLDRDGEVIQPGAFKERIGSFEKNPVVLWMHNAFDPPIGHVAEMEIGDKAIEGKIQFRPAGDDPLADNVFLAYASGDLTSFSIGFRVFKMDQPEIDEETGKQTSPPTVTEGELMELSAVTIPANTDAVSKHAEMANLLTSGLNRYLKVTGEKMPQVGRKLLMPSVGQPIYTATASDLAVLEKAHEVVGRLMDNVARKTRVSPEQLDALRTLRLSLVVSSAPEADESTAASQLLSEAFAACDAALAGNPS